MKKMFFDKYFFFTYERDKRQGNFAKTSKSQK